MIALDPFVLDEPVGRGGMGEVWRGHHATQGVPVAVKVITARRADDARIQAALRNEVRAVARLHHPHIILLVDHGVVDAAAAAASSGKLTAGSPFLAMELVSGGTVEDRRPGDWPSLRRLLLEILDGLAHAHAHGVIHRDLKPSNVLCAGAGDLRGGIRLSDFGIAHALEPSAVGDRDRPVSGTPGYMAPEQIAGSRRDEGPWTDLYALGVIAYQVLSGGMPFGSAQGVELLDRHLTAPVPVPATRFAVPQDLETWVLRLLAKRPCNRFERAADAAWALRALAADLIAPSHIGDEAFLADAPTGTVTTAYSPAWAVGEEATEAAMVGGGVVSGPPPWESEPVRPPSPSPPVPASWRQTDEPTPLRLLGAGLGLYGVRPVPMVGREHERDALWHGLRATSEQRTTRVMVVRGAAGHGKSRLVEWVAQRADEVGGATFLRVSHGSIAAAHDGLAGMVSALLGCGGLSREAAARRCRRFLVEHIGLPLESDEHLALAELALGDDGGGSARLSAPADRYFLVRRLLERLAAQRPVLLWLDDVQWGADAIGFARFALDADHTAPLPLMIVMTVRDEAIGDRPVEIELLADLEHRGAARRLDVGALPVADHAALVERLLGLSGPLVDEVVRRTDGNPLFAVQLVGDWVQRGALVAGATGFELAPGESAPLPDDIHALWSARVRRTLDGFPAAALPAIERAAALGLDVVGDEWGAACAVSGLEVAGGVPAGGSPDGSASGSAGGGAGIPAGIPAGISAGIPAGIVDALITHRLAHGTAEAWSFAHAMLRESLERGAAEAGRADDHHRACARALVGVGGDPAVVAERIGRHWLAAGELDAALGPLRLAAERRLRTHDLRQAQSLFAAHEQALRDLGADAADPRWGQGWVGRARAFLADGKVELARGILDRAEAAAVAYGWTPVLAAVLTARARLDFDVGDAEASHRDGHRALEVFAQLDDPHGLADCLIGLGQIGMWRWQIDEAMRHYRDAHQLALRTGDRFQLGATLRGLGNLRACQDDLAGGEELLVRALAIFQEGGNRGQYATCLNDLGEVARLRGDLARAEALYRQALTLSEALAAPEASTPRFNLGLVLLEKGRFAEARRHFLALESSLEGGERSIDLLWTHVALAACAAAEADWPAWDRYVGAVEHGLGGGLVDEDLARLSTRAADLTRDAADGPRARRLYLMAAGLWERLSQLERRDACRRAAEAL